MSEFDGETRIGIDESGKGDYFGPLVIAAVLVGPEDEPFLKGIGVRDSKKLTDASIARMAKEISGRCPYSVVRIGPQKYNELYDRIKNLNRLLAWGHSRAMENVLDRCPDCRIAISDQFGDEAFLNNALMKRGSAIKLVQMPRAEEDAAVAAASIMARAEFVRAMKALSVEAGMDLPKGASSPKVAETAIDITARYGQGGLARFVKLHFKTTKQVLAEAIEKAGGLRT